MIEKRGREWTRFDLVTLHYPAECNGFRVHLREEIRELQKAGSGIPEQKSPTVGLNVILALFSTWRECDLPLPPCSFSVVACFSVFSGIPCNLESDRALYVTRGFTEPLGFQLCLRAREIWTLANGIREFFLSRWKRGGGGARGSWAWGGGSKGICLVKDNNRLLGIGWFGNRTRSFRHLENVWFSNWSGIFLSFFFFCWIRIELSGDRMRNFLVRWEFFRIFRTILIKRKFEEGIFNDQVDYLSRRRNLNRYLWS